MQIFCIIVSLSRNSDGSFRVQLAAIADPNVQFQTTLPASEAQNAYIGRPVTMVLNYT
jgi:hypothetical protein